MDAISDPGRPRRRDRRRAQKLVDTAFAERRLTAADRTLRTQRVQAAHTRGDLAMITRDLVAPVQTNLGRALDPSTMSSMRAGSPAGSTSRLQGTTRRKPGMPATASPGTPTIDLSGIGSKVRLIVLIAVLGLFASCVLGLAALVIPAFLTESNPDVTFSTPGAPGASATAETSPRQTPSAVAQGDPSSLHTAAGWTDLVEAIEAESGTTEVYDLVAYPQYASVGLDAGDAVERRFYRNGGWQDLVSVRTPIAGSPVDLADIDAKVIARLPGETARHVGVDEPTGTYIIVNTFAGAPRLAVYVQSNGESRYRAYRLDGTPIN